MRCSKTSRRKRKRAGSSSYRILRAGYGQISHCSRPVPPYRFLKARQLSRRPRLNGNVSVLKEALMRWTVILLWMVAGPWATGAQDQPANEVKQLKRADLASLE